MPALLGRKIGMTRWFKEDGTNVPVTVIAAGPCTVTQIKRTETDGYSAVQLGFDEIKPRRTTMQLIGHDAKAGTTPKRCHTELRMADAAIEALKRVQAEDWLKVWYARHIYGGWEREQDGKIMGPHKRVIGFHEAAKAMFCPNEKFCYAD